MMQNKRIGLTGGIATGKSTVSRYLREKGLAVIDADKITHNLYDHSSGFHKSIIQEFGEEILRNGEIDRKKLGAIVFRDQERMNVLENIAHPLIFAEIMKEIERLQNEKLIFIDITLLFEVDENYRKSLKLNKIWLVFAPLELQMERLSERDGISKEEARIKMQTQMDMRKKIELSDVILYNNKNVDFLYKQVDNQLREEGIQ